MLLYVTSAVEEGFAQLLDAVETSADGAFVVVATRSAPKGTKPHDLRDWLTLPRVDPSGVAGRLLRLYAEQMRPDVAVFAGGDAREMRAACRPWVGATVLVGTKAPEEGEGGGLAGALDLEIDGPESLHQHRPWIHAHLPLQFVLDAEAPLTGLRGKVLAIREQGAERDVDLYWRGRLTPSLPEAIREALEARGRVRVQVGLRDGILGAPSAAFAVLRRIVRSSSERVEVRVVAEDGVAVPAARLLSGGLAGLASFFAERGGAP